MNRDKPNHIAVRVYDEQLAGGIIRGDIGIFEMEGMILPSLSIEGVWKFKTGDDMEWKNPEYSDKKWDSLITPSFWETQGYYEYDGFAWYRKHIFVPEEYEDKSLVLMMGKIDDIDQVYINGKLIGSTGDFNETNRSNNFPFEYQQFRGYYLTKEDINAGKENVIAVRVYDGYKDGGIYRGPLGFVTQSDYVKFWRDRKKEEKEEKSIFDILFGN